MPDSTWTILLRSSAELKGFVPQWKELWKEDSSATPFQTPEWLLPWWNQFGQSELRAAVVFHRNLPTAFLPFYIAPDPETGERKLLLLGVGTTDYLGGLFSSSCTLAQVRCGIRTLLQSDGWDSLVALQMKPGSLLCNALLQEGPGARHFSSADCSKMPALPLEQLPTRIRRNALYYRNRAQRAGKLELRIAEASDCIDAFHCLQTLHTRRWNLRGEPGVLADRRVLAWHREAIPLLDRCGLLRLCTLLLDGEPLGVLYSLVDPGWRVPRTQYFYLTAFSPDHAELRPGTLLLAYAIDYAAREGVQVIDMLRGQEVYKDLWHMRRFPTDGVSASAMDFDREKTA